MKACRLWPTFQLWGQCFKKRPISCVIKDTTRVDVPSANDRGDAARDGLKDDSEQRQVYVGKLVRHTSVNN